MLHGEHELGQHLGRMRADDGRPEDPVLARRGEHLDEARIGAVRDRAIQAIQFIAGDLDLDRLLARLVLGQSDPGHFRIGERGPGDDPVVDLERPPRGQQRIDCRVPGLMRGDMGELVGTGDIATDQDVGIVGAQQRIGLDGLAPGQTHAELLQPETFHIRAASQRQQQRVVLEGNLPALVLADDSAANVGALDPQRFVSHGQGHTLRRELASNQPGGIRILASQQTGRHLHHGDPAAEARERLCQLAADGSTAEHQQALRQLPQLPDRVTGQVARTVQSWNRGHQRPRTGGDDQAARGQPLPSDLDLPRAHHSGLAGDDLHTQTGVALDRVVRSDPRDHLLHPCHGVREIKLGGHRAHTVALALATLGEQAGGAQKGLGRHATGVQAVASHRALLDQSDTRLHGCGDVGRHQSGRAGPDHQQVVIETPRFAVSPIDPSRGQPVAESAGHQRQQAEQHQRDQETR